MRPALPPERALEQKTTSCSTMCFSLCCAPARRQGFQRTERGGGDVTFYASRLFVRRSSSTMRLAEGAPQFGGIVLSDRGHGAARLCPFASDRAGRGGALPPSTQPCCCRGSHGADNAPSSARRRWAGARSAAHAAYPRASSPKCDDIFLREVLVRLAWQVALATVAASHAGTRRPVLRGPSVQVVVGALAAS